MDREREGGGRDRTPPVPPDMGDDDQQFEIDLLRAYEEDPPRDRVITDEDRGEIGITEWLREEARRADPPPDDRPAEEAAVHIERREHHPPRDDPQ
ncbi:hypothetical protein LO762_14275 [Actinocorallia sp. API 0066]|uniref:hypothetical protein n=1 Tax=Actinocorallia sp. API 0066 TaxID=2896846 RepID=UPI001E2F939D|nr:hypothetical protein [Actinocorallia sp. API 0066]MCD0450350.1 hypothetical protein [Actinocorallia sp. API 0066]